MDALAVLIDWMRLLALALWVGGLAVLVLVLPAGRRPRAEDVALLEAARRRTQVVLWWSVVAQLVALMAEIILHARLLIGGSSGFRDALKALLFGSRYGIASVVCWWLLVVALLAMDELGRAPTAAPARTVRRGRQALGIVAGWPIAVTRAAWLRLATLLAAGVLVCTAVAGGYGAAPLPALAETLHLGAAAVWLGGTIVIGLSIAPFVSLIGRERRPLALLALLDRFSPVALLSVLVLALSGAWEASQRFHGLSTPFGRALASRALLLLLIVGLSAWSAVVWRPRLRRLGLRARRDYAAALRAARVLVVVRRLLWATPPLAMLALLLGAMADAAPNQATAATPRRAVTAAGHHSSAAAVVRGGWQELGPPLIVHSLVADPADHARLFEGTVAGVYRSTDGGSHWTAASTGLVGGGREVWSLTFIPDGSLIAATSAGLYRSTDGAAHWHPAGLAGRSIYTLATHLAGHIELLAGGDGGIFRSDDLMASWRQVYNSGANGVTTLAWPSVRPSLVVAGINPGPASIAISHDGGITWQTQTQAQGLPLGPGMMSVAVAPGAQIVYAGTMGLGVYVAQGPAGRWQGRNSGLPGLKTGDAHIGAFAFDPSHPRTLYAATDFGVYRSRDGGQHWSLFGSGLRGDATVVTSLTLVTGARPLLYATTAAGVYRLPLYAAA